MNFTFAEKINPRLEVFDFEGALLIAQTELQTLPVSPFHAIIGRSLMHMTKHLANWIDDFYDGAKKRAAVCGLYFELNEFDINTDYWFIDGFAYDDCDTDPDDMDWLSDFMTDARTETGSVFYIEDYRALQSAFSEIDKKKLNGDWTKEMQDARDWCEQIIIVQFMELMRNVHLLAKKQYLSWSDIPIYFTEHEYDFIVKSE